MWRMKWEQYGGMTMGIWKGRRGGGRGLGIGKISERGRGEGKGMGKDRGD